MQLVERHIITPTNKYYKELDEATFKSKNLYNSTLYAIRQHYKNNFKTLNNRITLLYHLKLHNKQ
jgi:putative transposase